MKNKIEPLEVLTTLDWAIFILALLVTFSAVIYGQLRKKKSDDESENFLDLLIMGRQLTLPLFVGTLVATWYGGIFGVTQIAFTKGIYNFITQGAFWYVSYIIFALFIADKVISYEAMTLPDLIGKMFGRRSAKLAAIFNLFNVLPIAYVISLGLFIKMIFNTDLTQSMIIGTTLVVGYSTLGGFRAVVFSDLIQFFVMCSGVFLILAISFYTYGGLDFLTANLPSGHFSPLGGESISTTLVWGFIAMSTLVDPNFYQRCFAANSIGTAKKGILISTVVWFCFDICTTFGAMYARAVIPESEPQTAYFTYSLQLIPPGLRGLFLAGILATILSTLDSYLFIAGTTLTFDLGPEKWRKKVNFHHLGILLVAVISIIFAGVFEGNIKAVWKTLGSYSASCLLFPVLMGYIAPRKIGDKAFITSCLSGVVGTTLWRHYLQAALNSQIDELYIGVLCTATSLFLFTFVFKHRDISS